MAQKPIPPMLCLADKNEAALTDTSLWKEYYTDTAKKYNWTLKPSSPDPLLVKDLLGTEALHAIHVHPLPIAHEYKRFNEALRAALNPQMGIPFQDKKAITEENFEEVYKFWEDTFGEAVRNGQKSSKYFVADIQPGSSIAQREEGKVLFRIGESDWREKKIFGKDYDRFWALYEKVSDPIAIRGILAKIDRLTDEALRRFQGEFFTPLPSAKKGLEYLEATLSPRWWTRGYRLWDMAAGTGNLEYYLPAEAYSHLYLSTLHSEDVEHCRRLFPGAECFQYDYLNDDVSALFAPPDALGFRHTWKLPQRLRNDLADPDVKWVVLINPPFATSQTAGAKGKSKADANNTQLRTVMHAEGLGEVSRELFSQFIFRVRKEFAERDAHLVMFSKIKYLNANNDQLLRDTVFDFGFERGFIFSVKHFSGTKGAFPVGFLIWDLFNRQPLEEQTVTLDVYETAEENIGTKTILNEHRDRFLSKWIDRPAATRIFPPFKSGINVALDTNKDVRDRVSEEFLGSLMTKGNDLQNQNYTAILSGPYVSAGAHSITPKIFEKSMVVHAVRRLPKATWVNDRDQFMQPAAPLPPEFETDCAVWSLFSSSNQTVALREVRYKGSLHAVRNHFFPFQLADVRVWKPSDRDIAQTLGQAEERYAAMWLASQTLSLEAAAVVEAARSVYAEFFQNLHALRTGKFRIETWDAGWWQVRSALIDERVGEEELEALKAVHRALGNKLRPQVYELGFLG